MTLRFARRLGPVFFCALMLLSSIPISNSVPAGNALTTNTFTFATAGNHGDITVPGGPQTTLNKLATSGVDFYLALGDLRYGTTDEQTWCGAFKSKFNNIELITGEHESGEVAGNGDISKFIQYCPFTLGAPLTSGAKTGYGYGYEYYFDYPSTNPTTRFILISPGINFNVGGLSETWTYSRGDTHYTWVSDAIDNARAREIPWVIVAMHKPCISTGEKTCETGEDINNLLVAKGVDLVLQAHDQSYQRSKQLVCVKDNAFRPYCVTNDGSTHSYVKAQGTVFQITGTFGEGHDAIKTTPDTNWFAKTDNTTFGYVKFTVSASGLTGQFVNTLGSFMENYGFTITTEQPAYPVLVGWGGMWTGESDLDKSNPNNPSSTVFIGEKASDAEMEMKYLVSHGYNTERVIFRSPFTSNGQNYPNERGYYDPWLNRSITIAKGLGIYVIVNMHSFCDWINATYTCTDPETGFVGSNIEPQWLSFWNTSVVQRYKNYYANIIWEPLNEPIVSDTRRSGTPLGWPGNPVYLQRPYQDFINTIRGKQGDTHWVIVSNANWDGDFPVVTDPLNRVLLNRHWYHFYNDGSGVYDRTAYLYPNYDASDNYKITTVTCSWNVDCSKAKGDDVNVYVRTAMARFGRPVVSTEVGAQWHDGTAQQPPDSLWNTGSCTYANSTRAFVQKTVTDFDTGPGRIGYTLWMNGHWDSGVDGCINIWGYQIDSVPAFLPQAQDFELTTSSSTIIMALGSSATATITVSSLNGFNSSVSLSASSSSSQVLATITPVSVRGQGSATLTVSGTAPGAFTLVVNGTSGSLLHTISLDVVITSQPDFDIAASTSFLTLGPGSSGTVVVTVAAVNGFSGDVTLSITTSSSVTYSLNPTTITGSGSSSLIVSGTPGAYAVTVVATSGSLTHSATVTLIVSQPSSTNNPPVLTIPGPETVQVGSLLTFQVSASDPEGPAETLTLRGNNLPAGSTFDPSTGIFSWNPSKSQVGSYSPNFTATDNGTPPMSDSKTLPITVYPVPAGPCLLCGIPPAVTASLLLLGGGAIGTLSTTAWYLGRRRRVKSFGTASSDYPGRKPLDGPRGPYSGRDGGT